MLKRQQCKSVNPKFLMEFCGYIREALLNQRLYFWAGP